MDENKNISISEEVAEELKELLQEKLWFLKEQIDKYSKIIASYFTDPDYEYKGCTLQQAENCGRRLGAEYARYISLFDSINDQLI